MFGSVFVFACDVADVVSEAKSGMNDLDDAVLV